MKKKTAAVLGVLAVATAAFFLYTADYYHADETALQALSSDEVLVEKTDTGWFFDGPGGEAVLVFYPGAKVEETAYAPLLHRIAALGVDTSLVRMPWRLAIFAPNRAADVEEAKGYGKLCLAGHSLGGVAASSYARSHAGEVQGLVLCASYPTDDLGPDLQVLSIYGCTDGVLNRDAYEKAKGFWPESASEIVIEGGNHAQFGSYGFQEGDGAAQISPKEQWDQAASAIASFVLGTGGASE